MSSRAWEALTPSLSEWVVDAVTSMGFKRMTPVQAATIPLFMAHKDVVVEAVTGSGKTLAFLIPVVERLLRLEDSIKKHHVGAIIISPTRELATQIYGVLQSLLAFHVPFDAAAQSPSDSHGVEGSETALRPKRLVSTSSHTVVPQLLLGGNTSPTQDLSDFLKNSPNLLISTPGRLLELLSAPHVHCPQSSFEVLVLDEADRLLDLGFKEDLQKILAKLPKQRRTGLFSASMSEAVDQLIRVGLRNPVKIAVKVKGENGGEDKRTPSSLQMSYMITPASHKFAAAFKVLSSLEPVPKKTIMYFSTCAAVDYFQHVLSPILPSRDGQLFSLVSLHGKHPAKVRQKNFTAFADSTMPTILLTTDVAARGLDIPQVDLVIQIDPPSDPKVFLHRCGRAGRAGRKGLSIIFLHPGREEDYLTFLEVRKTPVTLFSFPEAAPPPTQDPQTITEAIRKTVLSDRSLHDKAQRAFVSWVKAYSKHQASSIFRIGDLDWEDLGHAWGLLRLPRMPELQRWAGGERSLGVDVDFDSFAYKDKQREQQRREAQQQRRAAPPPTGEMKDGMRGRASAADGAGGRKTVGRAWSEKAARRDEREKRREKKKSRRERGEWARMTGGEREKKAELDRLIEQVKRERAEEERFGTFEGFGD